MRKNKIVTAILLVSPLMAATMSAKADENLFGYVKGAEVMPEGAWELDQTLTYRDDKKVGSYHAWDSKTEVEYGVTDRFNAVMKGDESAMNTLYQQLSRRIYAFALRRLSTPDAAEEVVVETMYEVWRSAKNFAGQSKVSTWILGIARYKVLDKMRKRGIQQTREIDDEALEIQDESPDTFEKIAQMQQAQQVKDCLETLPDDQRECMHLVFFEEMSLVAIAEVQQCPANTIKTRMFHARKKMRDCIEKQISWS